MSLPRPCVDRTNGVGCPNLVTNGSRCSNHQLPDRRGPRPAYQGKWQSESKKRREAHVAMFGWICPGWQRNAHESTDLVVDHDVGILCRPCNSRKGATVDKQRAQTARRDAE